MFAVSPASSEEHTWLVSEFDLDYKFLTDHNYELGIDFGFISLSQGTIYRGYIAVNPQSERMHVEVDYLVGQNAGELLAKVEDL